MRCLTGGGVIAAGGIIQKSGCAGRRILVSGVEEERSSANAGIKTAAGDA